VARLVGLADALDEFGDLLVNAAARRRESRVAPQSISVAPTCAAPTAPPPTITIGRSRHVQHHGVGETHVEGRSYRVVPGRSNSADLRAKSRMCGVVSERDLRRSRESADNAATKGAACDRRVPVEVDRAVVSMTT
jgi:hypothetical protein